MDIHYTTLKCDRGNPNETVSYKMTTNTMSICKERLLISMTRHIFAVALRNCH